MKRIVCKQSIPCGYFDVRFMLPGCQIFHITIQCYVSQIDVKKTRHFNIFLHVISTWPTNIITTSVPRRVLVGWVQNLKATPGCPQGSLARLITRLSHCPKQFCWIITNPWSYIVMVPSVCWYMVNETSLSYSSNQLHHLYHCQVLTCSSVSKVLVPKFYPILNSFYRPPWGCNTFLQKLW